MEDCSRSNLPPVLPALAEDLDVDPRRPRRPDLEWIQPRTQPDEPSTPETTEHGR